MTDRIEAQIERFAPGFRDLVLARSVRTAADEEAHNPNYVGGDIGVGHADAAADRPAPGAQVEPVPDAGPRRLPVLLGHPAGPRGARPVRRAGRADRPAGHVRRP